MKSRMLGLLVLVSLLGLSPASADTIYTYTGNVFTTGITGTYTATDKVTGTIDLSTALGNNFTQSQGQLLPIVSFSFTDGVQTLTNNTPGVSAAFTNFSTTGSGTIATWGVDISVTTSSQDFIETLNFFPFFHDNGTTDALDAAANLNNPGSWSVSQTPLPAALPLFATGLGGLGLLGWRRKRKAQAVA